MTAAANFLSTIGAIALLCAGAMIAPHAAKSMINLKANVDRYFTPTAEQVETSQRRNAAYLCPAYFAADSSERWAKYRNIEWCEKFPEYR